VSKGGPTSWAGLRNKDTPLPQNLLQFCALPDEAILHIFLQDAQVTGASEFSGFNASGVAVVASPIYGGLDHSTGSLWMGLDLFGLPTASTYLSADRETPSAPSQ
jgi:hypothetical protein